MTAIDGTIENIQLLKTIPYFYLRPLSVRHTFPSVVPPESYNFTFV